MLIFSTGVNCDGGCDVKRILVEYIPMALMIKFASIGRRGERKYDIVVKEKRSRRDGPAVETIGYYEKRSKTDIIKKVEDDRLKYWISKGAQMTPSVKKVVTS